MDYLRDSCMLRYVVYGAGTVIFSKICYDIYSYLWQKIGGTYVEINDVIMFNEVSKKCADTHMQSPDNFFALISENALGYQCKGKHCAVKNINGIMNHMNFSLHSIDVAIYTFTSYAVFESLKHAHIRGVSIRIIIDREMASSSGSMISSLTGLGIPVRSPSTTAMMHHKFCVVDGRLNQNNKRRRFYKGVVISGSVNWTKQAFNGNWENCIITTNHQIVEKFQSEFERMWSKFDVYNVR